MGNSYSAINIFFLWFESQFQNYKYKSKRTRGKQEWQDLKTKQN